MKKTLIFLALITGLFFVQCRPAQAQEPTPAAVEQADTLTPEAEADTATTLKPICFTTENDEKVCFDPTSTFEDVVATVDLYKEAKQAFKAGGLAALLIFLLGAAGKMTQTATSIIRGARDAGKVLKALPTKPHRIVAVVSSIIGVAAGFVWPKITIGVWEYSYLVTAVTIPAAYGVARFIYDEWIKKPEPVAAKQAPTINNA